eukprot:371088_1
MTDTKQLINRISQLSSEERDKELKCIYKIINNILFNPNQEKYKCLNIIALNKRLSNPKLWIELLLQAGFYKSTNENQLIFDQFKTDKLKYVNDLLLTCEWNKGYGDNKQNLSNSIIMSIIDSFDIIKQKIKDLNENKQNFSDDQQSCLIDLINDGFSLEETINAIQISLNKDVHIQYKCICGKYLTEINDSSTLYNGKGAKCDMCGKRGNFNETFWHCRNKNNVIHPGGFDVCSYCFVNNYKKDKEKWVGFPTSTKPPSRTASCDPAYCLKLQRFVRIMIAYNRDNNENDNHMNSSNIFQQLNDYLHLINQHYQDQQTEFILKQLGHCDITTCKIFRRNNRNRNEIKDSIDDINDIVYCQLMDKMHCHFQHCYDTGNKLTIKDKMIIYDECKMNTERHSKPNNEGSCDKYFWNKSMLKVSQILSSKQQMYLTISDDVSGRRIKKYNQLTISTSEQKETTKYYSFGYSIQYGYDGEAGISADSIKVTAKYSSLKQELTTNNISVLTRAQYDTEYTKAQIYFKSYFRKSNTDWNSMLLQHVLSVMVYCNYTELQYQFSKTYREDLCKNHNSFYYFGKYLKITVAEFGTRIMNGKIKKFYHGIGDKLSFPQCIGEHSNGVYIQCPLSTTSSFEVSTNFTNSNKGLIVQFAGFDMARYFSCSWLSDFANEAEHLFVQNYFGIHFKNIIEP